MAKGETGLKLTINSKTLLRALQTVSRAVSQKSPLPALTGVLVEADDVIRLTGTDFELRISTTIQGKVEEQGSIVIPARQFIQTVKNLPEGEVTITAYNDAVFTYNKGSITIPSFSTDEYPVESTGEFTTELTIPANVIANIVKYVAPATIKDNLRPALAGVYVRIKDGGLTALATDRYRAARYIAEVEGEMDCIIPARALSEVNKDVTVKLSDHLIVFETEDTTISARLLVGTIPFDTINGIFNQNPTAKVFDVPTDQLKKLLDRALVTTTKEDNYAVKLTVDNGLTVENQSHTGKFSEYVPIKTEGETSIHLSAQFLKDALLDDDVDIFFSGPVSVIGTYHEMVIMPIQMRR